MKYQHLFLVPILSAYFTFCAGSPPVSKETSPSGANYSAGEENSVTTEGITLNFPLGWTVSRPPGASGEDLVFRGPDGTSAVGYLSFKPASSQAEFDGNRRAFHALSGKVPGIKRFTDKFDGGVIDFAVAKDGQIISIFALVPEGTNSYLFSFTIRQGADSEEAIAVIRSIRPAESGISARRRDFINFYSPNKDWYWLSDTGSDRLVFSGKFGGEIWYVSYHRDSAVSSITGTPAPDLPPLRLGFPGIFLRPVSHEISGDTHRTAIYASDPPGHRVMVIFPKKEIFGADNPAKDPLQRLLRYYIWMNDKP